MRQDQQSAQGTPITLPRPDKHWVVVADHKKAHVYEKRPEGLQRVNDANSRCSKAFPEEGTGREDVFLRELAEWLDTAEREEAFDRLVLIAPPAALDEIRALMGEKTETKVCDALCREVEEATEAEIEDHLTEVMWL